MCEPVRNPRPLGQGRFNYSGRGLKGFSKEERIALNQARGKLECWRAAEVTVSRRRFASRNGGSQFRWKSWQSDRGAKVEQEPY